MVTVSASGGDSGWALHVHLYTGVSQDGPKDFGIDNTSTGTTVTVNGIDVSADGLVVMGAGNGSGSRTINSWTSPLTERTDGPDPGGGADLITASGIETSAQTNKTYVATWSSDINRATGIAASWDEASCTTAMYYSVGTDTAALYSGNASASSGTLTQPVRQLTKSVLVMRSGWVPIVTTLPAARHPPCLRSKIRRPTAARQMIRPLPSAPRALPFIGRSIP